MITTPRDLTTAVGFQTSVSAPPSLQQLGRIFNFVSCPTEWPRLHGYAVPRREARSPPTRRRVAQRPVRPAAGSASTDRVGPALRVTAIRPALGRVRGSALDTSGVRRVQVALRGATQGDVAGGFPAANAELRPAQAGKRPRWKTAQLTMTKKGARWLVELGGRLPVGR